MVADDGFIPSRDGRTPASGHGDPASTRPSSLPVKRSLSRAGNPSVGVPQGNSRDSAGDKDKDDARPTKRLRTTEPESYTLLAARWQQSLNHPVSGQPLPGPQMDPGLPPNPLAQLAGSALHQPRARAKEYDLDYLLNSTPSWPSPRAAKPHFRGPSSVSSDTVTGETDGGLEGDESLKDQILEDQMLGTWHMVRDRLDRPNVYCPPSEEIRRIARELGNRLKEYSESGPFLLPSALPAAGNLPPRHGTPDSGISGFDQDYDQDYLALSENGGAPDQKPQVPGVTELEDSDGDWEIEDPEDDGSMYSCSEREDGEESDAEDNNTPDQNPQVPEIIAIGDSDDDSNNGDQDVITQTIIGYPVTASLKRLAERVVPYHEVEAWRHGIIMWMD